MDKRLLIKAYHLKNVEDFLKLKEKTQRCQKNLDQNLVYHPAICNSGFWAFLILSKLQAVSYIWLFCLIGLGGYGYILHLRVLHCCVLFNQSMQKNIITSEKYFFLSELAHLRKAFIKHLSLFILLSCDLILLNYLITPGLYWSWLMVYGWACGFILHAVYYFNRNHLIKKYLIKVIGCHSLYWQKRRNKKQKINFSRYFDELLSCQKLIANHRVKLSFPQKHLRALSCFFDFLLALLCKIIRSERLGEMLKPHTYGLVFVRELKLIGAELKKPKQIDLAGRSLFLIQGLILELIEQRVNLARALETVSLRLKNTGSKSLDRHGFSSWERWPRFQRGLDKRQLKLKRISNQFFKTQAELQKLLTC